MPPPSPHLMSFMKKHFLFGIKSQLNPNYNADAYMRRSADVATDV